MARCLLAACVVPAAWADEAAQVHLRGETIVYRGDLSDEANARVRALLDGGHAIRWLEITSGGGDIALGMDLGELVRDHALGVAVRDYCASSCANYVFPAGKRKRLPADSVVVWHGSAIQAGIDDIATMDFSQVERQMGRALGDEEKAALAAQAGLSAHFDGLRQRQEAFYAAIGVDPRVTVFGQDVGCDCEWTVPVEDMRRFGIDAVEAPDGYGAHLRPKGRAVALLRLEDYPDYAAGAGTPRPHAAAGE
ncbi:hypothetical protein B1992_07115 [Pseudoxanthomonas broegbernensis]|uniref:Uncharacterized protein n=1 Tax=Pseudoxanthomonas broegbernensis TaxID=83619 RepID=A0A7V8GMU8_9GAMM|nr:hypothetical protein [Pseudoxanthomonas broegbernensis]KAF1686669.1 hypothetical protein B1992_07115 [Pseudoxanthomonas broegbernensis]MBB6063571.1 hypothetical protein [Pseudoxanthomonas broegbernensis]